MVPPTKLWEVFQSVSLSLGDPLQLRAVADKPFYAELQTNFNPVQTLGAGVCQEFLELIF